MQVCRLQDLPELALVLWSCVPCLLSVSLPCSRCVACKYGSISRSKGIFSAVWGFRVGLCCLGGLRGLCGFCTRVELGGLKACGVFASIYSFICLYLPLFAFLFISLLASCPFVLRWSGCLSFLLVCPLVFLVGFCILFFPFGLYAKRKGAPCWCVLSCPVVCVQILVQLSKNSLAVYLAFSSSSG